KEMSFGNMPNDGGYLLLDMDQATTAVRDHHVQQAFIHLALGTQEFINGIEKSKADLTRCANDILLAREAHFPATIADLYDPDNMPDNLRAAHERNDEVVERIYIGRRFRNDTERLEKLFELYTKMTAGQRTTKKREAGASA